MKCEPREGFLEVCSREGMIACENDLGLFVKDKKTMCLHCSREGDGLREEIRGIGRG